MTRQTSKTPTTLQENTQRRHKRQPENALDKSTEIDDIDTESRFTILEEEDMEVDYIAERTPHKEKQTRIPPIILKKQKTLDHLASELKHLNLNFVKAENLNAGKLTQLAAKANRLNIVVLELSEVRWTGFGEHELASAQVLLHSGLLGNNAPHEKGVRFLLGPVACKSLMEWQPVSERIIVARFKAPFRNVTFVQSYASTDDAKKAFYDQLTSVMNNVHKKNIIIQLGDMNAQMGSDNRDPESVMGKQALGTMTDNGEIYTNFCEEHELIIGGSLFPHHRKNHKVTWVSSDGFTENHIDHISISRRFKSSLLNAWNKRSDDIVSDHHLLIAVLRIRIFRVKPGSERVTRRYDVKKLQNPDTKANLLPSLSMTRETHGQWNHVKSAFLGGSDDILGADAMNAARTRSTKKDKTGRWLQKEKEVKKLCKRDKQRWINDLATEAEEAARINDTRHLFQIIRKLSRKRAYREQEEQICQWFEHFKDLFTITSDSSAIDFEHHPQIARIQRISSSTPTIDEIETAIPKLTPDFRGLPEGLRHVKTRHCMAGDGKEGNTKQTAKLSQGTV
ncbi:hypothetical protein ILUMI_00987 [Ignelater luminosus]|uniref:Endonuclease/exonuclease/phosphatase domain-containing protein n=1 Tax=Ignelater luminosus TaxID=2038154 RepID=A0A8K0DF92_IGNLU|nr:hypothetical protein ILUMI_00987 [Ignelater luminosus]